MIKIFRNNNGQYRSIVLKISTGAGDKAMRKFVIVFLVLILMLGGTFATAYAIDCTKDNLVDQFGDWFGNLGKKEKTKEKNIAIRKANRLADCAEKKAHEAAKPV